jgi:hypothetical protein
MDSHKLFQKYLDEEIPLPWILWPEKGKAKMRMFFQEGTTKALMDDLLWYIKEDTLTERRAKGFSCSEWLQTYFKTVRGRELVKRVGIARHEPLLFTTASGIEPLKGLLDGFIMFVMEKEIVPCLK